MEASINTFAKDVAQQKGNSRTNSIPEVDGVSEVSICMQVCGHQGGLQCVSTTGRNCGAIIVVVTATVGCFLIKEHSARVHCMLTVAACTSKNENKGLNHTISISTRTSILSIPACGVNVSYPQPVHSHCC